ncbi:MAG: hypothetical protein ACT4OV_16630 [Microthrixaceae bacterium]
MGAAVVALGLVTAVLAILVIGLLRSHADILRALHDLGVGEAELADASTPARRRSTGTTTRPAGVEDRGGDGRVHPIVGSTPDGGAVRVALDEGRGTTLLAFLSSGCTTCHDFWRAFDTDAVNEVPGRDSRVVVVTRGPTEESISAIAELAPSRAITVLSSEAWDSYGIPVSPYFMLIDGAHGIVGEGAAPTWPQVLQLMRNAIADAGLDLDDPKPSRRDLLMGRDRERRADREITRAGILPGDASLYRPSIGELDATTEDAE